MLEDLFDKGTKIKFKNRPIAVPYNYRIVYKVSQIVLILGTVCKRGGCSNVKLHIISNAISSNNMLKDLEKLLNDKTETLPIVRFEPAITRAVIFAIADELVEVQSSNLKLKLTDKGKSLYSEIMQNDDIMTMEKADLIEIKDKIKDSTIDKIVEKWEATDVTN